MPWYRDEGRSTLVAWLDEHLDGPPFPLVRADLALLEVDGVSVIELAEEQEGSWPTWRAVLRRGPRP